jgi:hypothetical protein
LLRPNTTLYGHIHHTVHPLYPPLRVIASFLMSPDLAITMQQL